MRLSELHSGDLLYWRGTGIWPALIRWWTRPNFWKVTKPAPFSHVGVYWGNGGSPMVLESADPGGVRFRALSLDMPDAAQKTHSAWTDQTFAQARTLEGRPYSRWTAILTPFKLAGRGSSAFMCSELAMRVLTLMGWDFKGYQATPEGLRATVFTATGNDAEDIE